MAVVGCGMGAQTREDWERGQAVSAGSEDGGYHAQVLVFLTKRGDSQGCACSGLRGCKQV